MTKQLDTKLADTMKKLRQEPADTEQKKKESKAPISATNNGPAVNNTTSTTSNGTKPVKTDPVKPTSKPTSVPNPVSNSNTTGSNPSGNPSNGPGTGQVIQKYNWGDFSKFAVERQNQISAREMVINDVIKEAMISHLERLKSYQTANQQLNDRSAAIQKNIKDLAGDDINIYKMIRDPAEYMAKVFCQRIKTTDSKSFIQSFIQILFSIKSLSVVDGKLIDEADWNMISMSDANEQNILLQSKTNPRVFVSLGKNKLGTHLFQWAGSLHTREQILQFDEKERAIMITMILSYLSERNIVTNENQLSQTINKVLQNAIKPPP